jgi:lauroyl/myristoyl acyltransferase
MADGQGAILVGSHLGAHLSGLHWLFRSGLPVRALVQRPCHLSHSLARLFDQTRGNYPQSDFFLRRRLPPTEAVDLLIRARAALRDGHSLYFCGDVPWPGHNARTGQLLGRSYRFLAIWTELAVLTRAPVFHVFCSHLPGGRYRLEIEDVGRIQPGEEDEAVADYLKQLEARIAIDPSQAVAHLLWPCFQAPSPGEPSLGESYGEAMRPSRRRAINAR